MSIGSYESHWTIAVTLPRFKTISRDIKVDAIVIGGGLTGITAAYLLKKSGAKVALLERGRCAAADTGHTTAHLTYVNRHHVSEHDLHEDLRLAGNIDDLKEVKIAYLERSGEISVQRQPQIFKIEVKDGVQTIHLLIE